MRGSWGSRRRGLIVESPTAFDLVHRLKTAKAHGVPILQAVLIRTVEVIQRNRKTEARGAGRRPHTTLLSSPLD